MFAARLTRIVALAMMVGFTNAQTAPSSNLWWNVDDSNVCPLIGHNCVTDGAGSYGSSERCTITALQPLYIKVTEFCTESTFDRLSITTTSYSGESGPHRVFMSAGESMTWTTEVVSRIESR